MSKKSLSKKQKERIEKLSKIAKSFLKGLEDIDVNGEEYVNIVATLAMMQPELKDLIMVKIAFANKM